jgi:hypothetical protein
MSDSVCVCVGGRVLHISLHANVHVALTHGASFSKSPPWITPSSCLVSDELWSLALQDCEMLWPKRGNSDVGDFTLENLQWDRMKYII